MRTERCLIKKNSILFVLTMFLIVFLILPACTTARAPSTTQAPGQSSSQATVPSSSATPVPSKPGVSIPSTTVASGPTATPAATAAPSSSDSISGAVNSTNGPEAGVWVIAETTDLPTRLTKIVVTDDQGHYLIPELPKANYDIWVRGYGLVDSAKIKGTPGQNLNLTAVVAPNDAAAAKYYPAIYWYSMLKIPDQSQFGGSTSIPKNITQTDWLTVIKNQSCVGCHQQGGYTRTIEPQLGTFPTSEAAWLRRVQSGQAGASMIGPLSQTLGGAPYKYFADWTDRIAKGELPKDKPQRPQGMERNVVITEWEWATPTTYIHDPISTDKRNPTVNAYGPIYGPPELSTDRIPILDPKTNTVTYFQAPVRDDNTQVAPVAHPVAASPQWGEQAIWNSRINNHNETWDQNGHLWLAATVRGLDNPSWAKKGSTQPSAQLFPLDTSSRQLAMFDPKTGHYTFADTAFSTQHLAFGFDADNTLWFSGSGPVIGWFNTKKFLETSDAQSSQGWSPFILDYNGNGKRDDYTEPGQPPDPTKDMRITGSGGVYAVMPSPVDGSIWGTVGVFSGTAGLIRIVPGSNPPSTTLAQIYNVPKPYFGIRGADIDSKGVVWASLGSGQLASFDLSKVKGALNGPTATGDQGADGWTVYQYPGPGFDGIGPNSAEASYYTFVDQKNTLGLGNDVPISTGNENEGLLALVNGKFITLRVPYPLGFYNKGMDGRIDDPNGGWNSRGVWTSWGDRTPWFKETGPGSPPRAVHFQIRPNPLATSTSPAATMTVPTTTAGPVTSSMPSNSVTTTPAMTMPPSSSSAPPASGSSPTTSAPAPTGSAITINLIARNVAFDQNTITVPVNSRVTINFNNMDIGIPHNFAIYTDSSASTPIFVGNIINGPNTITYQIVSPSRAGTYFFRCDAHPTLMTGKFVVQ
jgi:plastocyanin